MTKIRKFKAKNSMLTVKHRAVCDKGDFRGDWFADIEEAAKQGVEHQLATGGEIHIVSIETELRQRTKSYL